MSTSRVCPKKLIIVGLLFIGVFILILFAFTHLLEPRYKGKPLSYWVEAHRINRHERITALREMKTQAVPLLMKHLSVKPSAIQQFLRERAPKFARFM